MLILALNDVLGKYTSHIILCHIVCVGMDLCCGWKSDVRVNRLTMSKSCLMRVHR